VINEEYPRYCLLLKESVDGEWAKGREEEARVSVITIIHIKFTRYM
jgi:hypothetical protein